MSAWSKENELSALSDAELVQCYLDGNSSCFTKLVERYHTHVHNLLHYKLHNPVWEKDAEQETFIAFALEIRNGTYHDTGHLRQHLNTIAWTQALLILRKEHHYVHDNTALRDDVQKEEPQEEIYTGRDSNSVLVRLAMKKLSLHQREAVRLRDWDELSFGDIGLQLQISEVTARTTYFKAKRHLKQIITHIINERRAALNSRNRT